ncbi:hypothetical protein IWW55_002853 [Coemansia sp. RSA 2706]|nr:hypothetical protein IWW55_002853 [Coemansia sp. RSA 2706]KAJ2318533.1 hypothetical protein IWW52_002506 [Coemansia sp. RSA 2704]KAJ2329191.1 hypothetical protein IWW51_000747 [Coemansia sp. RSA 2702]KAJ2714115.1 hypothetical protein H4R23_005837 [Coemansia sp. Cherry 401B]
MSAGAIEKDHHIARNGAQLSHLDKKNGAGKYNWGDDMVPVDELEDRGEIDNTEKLDNDQMSYSYSPQSKVQLMSLKEFDAAKKASKA